MSEVNKVDQQVNAFKNLMLQARTDEKNSIVHFNALMSIMNNITIDNIKNIMPTVKLMVTRYGSMQALNMVAPEGFVKCQQFLDDVIISYHLRTSSIRTDRDKSGDPKIREIIDHREKVLDKLLRKWETNYIVPIIQRAEIKYVSVDASSETTFIKTLDSVKAFIAETQPEEVDGISKGNILSGKH